jgi:ubiquinone/menaquinone biosynthesis C-methylase UbiE
MRTRLAGSPEILDGPPPERALHLGSLRDLERVNRWLGGLDLSRRAVARLAGGRREVSIIDVGTGGGDIPAGLITWGRRRGVAIRALGVDERPQTIELARYLRGEDRDLHFEVADGRGLGYPDGAFDIAHASLVAHHLEPADLVGFLRELGRVARLGVVVNDLDRAWWWWAIARCLGPLFTRNAVTRHDGAMSVRRAYRADEIAAAARQAGLVETGRLTGLLGHRYAMIMQRAAAASGAPPGTNESS